MLVWLKLGLSRDIAHLNGMIYHHVEMVHQGQWSSISPGFQVSPISLQKIMGILEVSQALASKLELDTRDDTNV